MLSEICTTNPLAGLKNGGFSVNLHTHTPPASPSPPCMEPEKITIFTAHDQIRAFFHMFCFPPSPIFSLRGLFFFLHLGLAFSQLGGLTSSWGVLSLSWRKLFSLGIMTIPREFRWWKNDTPTKNAVAR